MHWGEVQALGGVGWDCSLVLAHTHMAAQHKRIVWFARAMQARRPWLLAVEDPQEPGKDIASGSFGVKGGSLWSSAGGCVLALQFWAATVRLVSFSALSFYGRRWDYAYVPAGARLPCFSTVRECAKHA